MRKTPLKKRTRRGFSLVELLIVLTLMAVILSVVAPYSGKSGNVMKLKQEALSLVQAVHYAIDHAKSTGHSTRLVIDRLENAYSLQADEGIEQKEFKSLLLSGTTKHVLDKSIRFTKINNFTSEENSDYLIFDPVRPWPIDADITIQTDTQARIVKIKGHVVEETETVIPDR